MKRKFRVDASKKVEASRLPNSMLPDLDGRFSFDLDDEFNIYLDTTTADINCYVIESEVFGDGAGVRYTVAVAIPQDDAHWQIKEDIERNLDRYIKEQTDGSDYTGWVENNDTIGTVYDIPDDVFDSCKIYVYDICVVPYQNISPWGEYGIDYGTEEYLDHVTKGTKFPPDYE